MKKLKRKTVINIHKTQNEIGKNLTERANCCVYNKNIRKRSGEKLRLECGWMNREKNRWETDGKFRNGYTKENVKFRKVKEKQRLLTKTKTK